MKQLITFLMLYLVFAFSASESAFSQCTNVSIIANPAEVCLGASTELIATWPIGNDCDPDSYIWKHTSGTIIGTTTNNTFTVTPTTAPSFNTFFVELINTAGMVIATSTQLTVPVNSPPTVSITNNPPGSSVCDGTPVVFTANPSGGSGGYIYLWEDGFTGQSKTETITFGNSMFAVTVTDSKGCSASTTKTVVAKTNPTACIDSTTPVTCVGDPVTFSTDCSSGVTNCSWSPTTWLNNANSCNPIWTPTGEGQDFMYTLTVTASNGCTATATLSADALDTPMPVISGPSSTCIGDNINLTGGGGGTCSWSPANLFDNPNNCNPQFLSNQAGVGTHQITLTISFGNCSNSTTTSITVFDTPEVLFTQDPVLACPGEPRVLDGCNSGNGLSYAWFPTTGLSNPDACNTEAIRNNQGSFDYTLTVEDLNGCTDSDVITLEVESPPSAGITITNGAEIICPGGQVSLTADSGGASYEWSTGSSSNNITESPLSTTTYSVTVTGGGSGCTNSSSQTIQVVPDPQVSIDASTDVICAGQSFTLMADLDGGTGSVTYCWQTSTDDGQTWSSCIGDEEEFEDTIVQTTAYRVSVTVSGAGCNGDISPPRTIPVVPLPSPVIDGSLEVCKNQQTIYFVENPVSQTSSSFVWKFSPSSPYIVETVDLGSYIFVQWSDQIIAQDPYRIRVIETVGGVGSQCVDSTEIIVTGSGSSSRDAADIIYTPVNDILIVKDPDAECYQWGYLDTQTGESVEIDGENYQAFAAGISYDEDLEYWVKTWDGDCSDSNTECATFSFRIETLDGPLQEGKRNMNLFPNPNKGVFRFEVNQLPDDHYTVMIVDALGRVVAQKIVASSDGEISESLQLTNLAHRGLYLLVLKNDSGIEETVKFIVY